MSEALGSSHWDSVVRNEVGRTLSALPDGRIMNMADEYVGEQLGFAGMHEMYGTENYNFEVDRAYERFFAFLFREVIVQAAEVLGQQEGVRDMRRIARLRKAVEDGTQAGR